MQYLISLVLTLRYCHVNDSIFKSNKEAVPGKPCSYLVVFFSALIKEVSQKMPNFPSTVRKRRDRDSLWAGTTDFTIIRILISISLTYCFCCISYFFHGKWEKRNEKRKVNLSACSDDS